MGIKLITPPAVEPITLADAKAFLRVDGTDDVSIISAFLTAARMYCEQHTQRQFITATYKVTADFFPLYAGTQFAWPFFQQLPANSFQAGQYGYVQVTDYGVQAPPDLTKLTLPNWGNISLPKPPLQSITSIQYIDTTGTLQTWSNTNYQVVSTIEPGYIKPNNGWPSIMPNTAEAVSITYVAGYGSDGSYVPAPIIQAIKLLLGTWYETRQATEVGESIAQAVDALLRPYVFDGFF